VRQGRLSDARQIFDLTIADIDHALVHPDINLQALCDERTMFIKKLNRSPFAVRIIDSRGKIFMPPPCETKKGIFNGVAISPGVVKGRAKVLHVPDEKELLPGEILVVRATNPGWTPLFINAAGIVLEIGGTLQHGAVVAREYGIPCISGITGAVEKIQDGQLLEVDGSNGILRVVDEANADADPLNLAAEKEKRKMERILKKRQAIKKRILQRLSLLLVPLVPLLLFMVFYSIFHALMGQDLATSFSQMKDLWGRYGGVLEITTVIFPILIIGAVVLRIVRKRKKASA
jgi:phosphohistidine swiveling domain-containing protein